MFESISRLFLSKPNLLKEDNDIEPTEIMCTVVDGINIQEAAFIISAIT